MPYIDMTGKPTYILTKDGIKQVKPCKDSQKKRSLNIKPLDKRKEEI